MDAKSYLEEIAQRFSQIGLDAVMIGNAAAAINGAPVTTLDVDFMLEQNEDNYRLLALEDVIASKRAAAREKDIATIPVLEMTLDEKQKQSQK